MTPTITHTGTVESIDGLHLHVRILQAPACAACSAKGLCSSAESKEKVIDVWDAAAATFHVGEEVMLISRLSQGFRAVMWAYAVPLLWVLVALFVGMALLENEALAALSALLSLIPYYIGLYLLRGRLARKFTFSIQHLN